MASERTSDDVHWLTTETPEDWVATDHDRVYIRTGSSRLDSDHAVVEAGRKVADEFPPWDVVITIGPYRGYDVQWRSMPKSQSINLDFHSVRPGIHYIDNVIQDIEQALTDSTDD